MDKPGNVAYSLTTLHHNCLAVIYVLILALPHTSGSVASLRNTRVGTAPASCIPAVAVLAGVV